MANFKGTGIIVFDKFFAKKGPDMRTQFLDRLTPEERKVYNTTMSVTWIPVEMATTLTKKAAEMLYPNDPQALFKIGWARAEANVNGVYRLFFKILNEETVLNQSAKLWPQHHDEGRASVERMPGAKGAYYCVSGYPSLPEDFRKVIEGFVAGIMSLCGAKNIKTHRVENNPQMWKWGATWD